MILIYYRKIESNISRGLFSNQSKQNKLLSIFDVDELAQEIKIQEIKIQEIIIQEIKYKRL